MSPELVDCGTSSSPWLTAFGVVMLIAVIATYVPQIAKIILRGSSDGVSYLYLTLGTVSVISCMISTMIFRVKAIQCCSYVGFLACFSEILDIAQLFFQSAVLLAILTLYYWYYPDSKKDSPEWRAARWSLVLMVIFMCLCTGLVATILSWNGPMQRNVGFLLGVASVFLVIAQYFPQLLLTYSTKSIGALSMPMLCLQAPGGLLFAIFLATRNDSEFVTWSSYLLASLLQFFLLIMCAYFERTTVPTQQFEAEPLLDTED